MQFVVDFQLDIEVDIKVCDENQKSIVPTFCVGIK